MPKHTQTSFAAGELAPSMYSRVDFSKYHSGAAEIENWYVHRHGGSVKRPGFRFVHDLGEPAWLVPFEFNVTQTYQLVFLNLKMLISKDGAMVATPGPGATEIVSPYTAAQIPQVRFAQSADTMFLVHPDHPPKTLTRTDHHLWTFTDIDFQPSITAPAGLAGVRSGPTIGSVTRNRGYKVAAITESGEESEPTASVTVSVSDPWQSGEIVTLNWDSKTGAARYAVYKNENGFYAYIGTAEHDGGGAGAEEFIDTNISPDSTITPKEFKDHFSGADLYPGAVALFEQRAQYARTNTDPQTAFGTTLGTFDTFTISTPLVESDAFEFPLVSEKVNEIKHLTPLGEVVVAFTAGKEWTLQSGVASDAIGPTSARFLHSSNNGTGDVHPVRVEDSLLYVARYGRRVHDFRPSPQRESRFVSSDLTLLVDNHMFAGATETIRQMAYQRSPDSLTWFVLDDGSMRSLTYLREQEVYAWARHDTLGEFQSVSSIPGALYDEVYAVVKRTINSVTKYYLEVMADRWPTDRLNDAFFVDSGLTYDGAPATTISGLDHLEGEAVSVLADGSVVEGKTVASGSITLPTAASKVHVGLPYTATLHTLPLSTATPGELQGRSKTIGKLHVHMQDTRGLRVGPTLDLLVPMKNRENELMTDPTALATEELDTVMQPKSSHHGQFYITSPDPLPASVLGFTVETSYGG